MHLPHRLQRLSIFKMPVPKVSPSCRPEITLRRNETYNQGMWGICSKSFFLFACSTLTKYRAYNCHTCIEPIEEKSDRTSAQFLEFIVRNWAVRPLEGVTFWVSVEKPATLNALSLFQIEDSSILYFFFAVSAGSKACLWTHLKTNAYRLLTILSEYPYSFQTHVLYERDLTKPWMYMFIYCLSALIQAFHMASFLNKIVLKFSLPALNLSKILSVDVKSRSWTSVRQMSAFSKHWRIF